MEHKNGTIEHITVKTMIPVSGGTYYLATTHDGRTRQFGFYSNAVRWLDTQ